MLSTDSCPHSNRPCAQCLLDRRAPLEGVRFTELHNPTLADACRDEGSVEAYGVYADWLEERGGVIATLVRTQLAMRALHDSNERTAKRSQIESILRAHPALVGSQALAAGDVEWINENVIRAGRVEMYMRNGFAWWIALVAQLEAFEPGRTLLRRVLEAPLTSLANRFKITFAEGTFDGTSPTELLVVASEIVDNERWHSIELDGELEITDRVLDVLCDRSWFPKLEQVVLHGSVDRFHLDRMRRSGLSVTVRAGGFTQRHPKLRLT